MATETLYATSLLSGTITSSSNALGSGAGTWAGDLNTNSSWTTVWAMGDPTVSGAADGTQTVTVRARKGSNGNSPTIAINLYENGSLVGAIASATTVTSTTGQDVSGTWTGSSVTNENNVEIEVVMTAAGGSPSNRNSAQIDYIRWDGNFAAAPQVIGVGFATETDTAVGVSKIDPIQVALGTATETDAAVGVTLTVPTIVAVGAATETDSIPSGVVDNATESEMFETGADGDAIGTTYGIFDDGSDTGTASWEVDNLRAAVGNQSGWMSLATADSSYRWITVSGGDQTIIQIRWYMYIGSTGITGTNVHFCRATRAGGALVARATIGSDQVFSLNDGTTGGSVGTVDFDTASGGLFQKWIRYEWEIDTVADTQTLNMFVDTNLHGLTPDYTITHTISDTVGVGRLEFGSTLTVGEPLDVWWDAVGYLPGSTSPGPVTGSPALGVKKSKALGTATETDTAVGVATGGTVVALGTATETDTAVGVAKIDTILVTLGTATETDTATGVTQSKVKALGSAAETDAGVALSTVKVKALGSTAETDSATGVGRSKVKGVGAATETDTATGVSALTPIIVALGSATETDTATGVGKIDPILRVLGVGLENDTPTGLGKAKRKALGVAAETDTPTGVTRVKRRAVGTASETDAATGVAKAKRVSLGNSTETDTAVGVAKIDTILVALGTATETDTAESIVRLGNIIVALGTATETDTAVGLGVIDPIQVALGTATSSETAASLAKIKTLAVGSASESDAATGPGKAKVRAVGTAAETDTAVGVALIGQQIISVGTATETDAATGLTKTKRIAVGVATETDAATGVTRVRAYALGVAAETDTATGVGVLTSTIVALGTATETDTAVGVGLIDTILRVLGTATETDTAVGLVVIVPQILPLGTATESDTAVGVTRAINYFMFIPPASAYENRYPRDLTPKGRLFSRVSGSPIHYCVMIFDADTTPRVVKTTRPRTDRMAEADFVYLGPREYQITEQEADILAAAGYDVSAV
jgi:hypothetical protein